MRRNSFILAIISLLYLCAAEVQAEDHERVLLRSPFEGAVRRAVGDSPHLFSDQGAGKALGGIVPHHDLALDMIVKFYSELAGKEVRRVFLFAPDHFRRVRLWAAICPSDWKLSSKTLSSDVPAVEALSAMNIVEARSDLFAGEHGITLHIPLIARFFPGASVVPIVLRPDIPDLALLSLRERLSRLLGEGDIVILSMDLSHYKPPEAMASEDEKTLAILSGLKAFEARHIDADARRAAALVLMLFRDRGAERGEVLEYSDSSAILGHRVESGTSYATLLYRSGK